MRGCHSFFAPKVHFLCLLLKIQDWTQIVRGIYLSVKLMAVFSCAVKVPVYSLKRRAFSVITIFQPLTRQVDSMHS